MCVECGRKERKKEGGTGTVSGTSEVKAVSVAGMREKFEFVCVCVV